MFLMSLFIIVSPFAPRLLGLMIAGGVVLLGVGLRRLDVRLHHVLIEESLPFDNKFTRFLAKLTGFTFKTTYRTTNAGIRQVRKSQFDISQSCKDDEFLKYK